MRLTSCVAMLLVSARTISLRSCQPLLAVLGFTSLAWPSTPPPTFVDQFVPVLAASEFLVDVGGVHVVTSDLDRDGSLDLAYVTRSDPRVHFMHGEGVVGEFTHIPDPVILDSGTEPRSMIVMDVNSDEWADLVVAGYGMGHVIVLRNRGADAAGDWQGFEPPCFFTTLANYPAVLGEGDVDGDGESDLIVGVHGWHEIQLLQNLGVGSDGTWQGFGEPVHLGQLAFPRGITTGDYDQDGKIDVIALGSSFMRGTWVLWNDSTIAPDGSFVWSTLPAPIAAIEIPTSTVALAPSPLAIAGGDFDGDGVPEFAVTHFAPHGLKLFRPVGRDFVVLERDDFIDSPMLVSADLNGDGLDDLASATGTGEVALLSADPVEGWGPLGSFSYAVDALDPLASRSLAVGDLDMAGDLDLVVASSTSSVGQFSLLMNQVPTFVRGDANLGGQVDIADVGSILGHLFLATGLSIPAAGDVNDDGDVEITDAVILLAYLFASGPAPESPFPSPGPDPSV